MKLKRVKLALAALLLVMTPVAAHAQAKPTAEGGSASMEAPVKANLGALPRLTPQEVANLPAAPPVRTAFTPQQYAAVKAIAAERSAALGGAVAAPVSSGSGAPETPYAATAFRGAKEGCATYPSAYVPPDMALAVNQSYVVQAVNSCIAVYNKSGALEPGFPKSLNAFVGAGANAAIFDPRAIYDWVHNRFILVLAKVSGSGKSKIVVAVSRNSDPTGGWYIYILNLFYADFNPGDLADFPELGQDRKAIYVSFNHFTTSSYADAHVLVLPKSPMYAGSSFSYFYFHNFSVGGQNIDTIQPANEYSPSDRPRAEFLINSANINFGGGGCSSSCNGLVVWAISNPLAKGGAALPNATGQFVATANNYQLPPNARQPGCSATSGCALDTDDVRISGSVEYHAGSMYASLNTASKSAAGSHVLWFEVQPFLNDNDASSCGSGTNYCPDITGAKILNEDCFNCGSNGDWYYGTLQSDLENNATMVFNYSDASSYPGVAYTTRRSTQASNTMHDSGFYIINGQAFYNQTPVRWGDYSATAPDLSSSRSSMWVAGEYSKGNGLWGTAIADVGYNAITDP